MLFRLLLLLLLGASTAAQAADPPEVRVRLLDRDRPAQAAVRAVDGAADVIADGRTLLTLGPGGVATVEKDGNGVVVRAYSVIERAQVVTIAPRSNTPLQLIVGRDERPYRGALEVRAEAGSRPALALINVIDLEHYVASVIPSEYPFPEPEGVKAQAVLVRTYALKSRGRFGAYDLVDHVGSQVYRGMASETPVSLQAVADTRGEILTYRGEPIEAVYSSSSGGHTADNDAIWTGPPLPYLRGRPDPYDHASPLHRWSETVEADRLLRALSRHYGFSVTGISPAGTSPEGRVTGIHLHGARAQTEQANRFRLLVNDLLGRNLLKSTFFTVQRQGGRYVFTGRGFGHGVGMSQYGAREQARQGRSYTDILAFYYTGVTLERPASLAAPPRPLAEAPSPEKMESAPPRPIATETTRERMRRAGW